MQVKSAAALLLAGLPAALSFLIVPDVAPADEDGLLSILPVEAQAGAEAHIVDLPCAGCPVRLDRDGDVSTDIQNHLELSFRIDRQADADRLLVNSFELYPNADPFSGLLAAPQVVDVALKDRRGMMMGHHRHHGDEMPHMGGGGGRHMMPDAQDEAAPETPLGYRIDVYPVATDEADQKLELINVDLQIIEVGRAFVDGLPMVQVKLVKNGDSLAIAKIDTTEQEVSTPPAKPKCEGLWCALKDMLDRGMGSFRRPCPGAARHGHHGAMHGGDAVVPPPMPMDVPGHGHPYHHHPHHNGSHHHHPHHGHHGGHHGEQLGGPGFVSMVAGSIRHVILPVLVGITAGVGISLVGMVVISSVLCLVRLLRGQGAAGGAGRCPFARRRLRLDKESAAEAALLDGEKSGLMADQEHQEPPPRYEDDA